MDLPSNGQPVRVEVARILLPARVSRVAYPEIAFTAHYRATLELSAPQPLLAGPARLARDQSLVGRSRLGFAAPGQAFEVGFGPDDAVRIRRRRTEKRDRVPVIGTQKIVREVTVFLSNLSDESRILDVVERVPVSEVQAVEIKLLDTEGWDLDAKDGFLSASIDLGPRQTLERSFKYEIRAGSDVVLPTS